MEARAGGQDQVTGSGPGEIGNDEQRGGQRARQGLGKTQDKDGGITKRDQGGEAPDEGKDRTPQLMDLPLPCAAPGSGRQVETQVEDLTSPITPRKSRLGGKGQGHAERPPSSMEPGWPRRRGDTVKAERPACLWLRASPGVRRALTN